MHSQLVTFVRDLYQTQDFIPLHAPSFTGNEKAYLNRTIDSTFVSSVGEFVDQFEAQVQDFTQSSRAIATVNGTAALHAALYMADVRAGDLVDRKSTRLNSSHVKISYAVFCLKKKKEEKINTK